MSVVLAIEPDSSQADSLRQLVREQLEAELVVVTSAYAAIVAMNRQVPDILLFGRSVAQRHQQTVLKHLRSLTEGEVPQVLTIPALTGTEQSNQKQKSSRFGFGWGKQSASGTPAPHDFIQQIIGALGARGSRRAAAVATPKAQPPAVSEPIAPESIAPTRADGFVTPQEIAAGLDTPPETDFDTAAAQLLGSVEPEGDARTSQPAASYLAASSDSDIDSLITQLGGASVSFDYEGTAETEEQETEDADPAGGDEVSIDLDGGWDGDERVDAEVHAAEIALVQAQAEAKLASEIERIRAEAEAERARLEVEAERRRQEELERARAEAEAERVRDLARIEAEAERRRQEELERARADAEAERAREVARLEEEAERRRQDEVARARAEAELKAREALTQEFARLRQAEEERFAAELARARA